MNGKGYALVTGASQGLGAAIARQLAERGYDLLLVARSETKLAAVGAELSGRFSVHVYYFSADLSTDLGVNKLCEWIRQKGYAVAVLINNAGYGLWGRFDNLPIADQSNMIDLNVRSLTQLTYHLLPSLLTHTRSYLLNVGSLAAYQAVPTLAVYAASKAYVMQFSRALRHEFGKAGLSVSVLNPGPVATGFGERAGMQSLKRLMDRYNMDAEVVAMQAVGGLFRRKSEIVPGIPNKIAVLAARLLPKSLLERIAANLYDQGSAKS